jgi:FkbM family methyltransferase
MSATTARTGAAPFTLVPTPARAGTCPRCGTQLDVTRLRLSGWRLVLDGTCEGCGHRYLQDLPSGHGLVYPSTLDLTSGETFDPAGATWFSASLRPAWETPDARPVKVDVTINERRNAVVFLSCVDPIYGHALLKLLNVQRELHRDDVGCVVVIPSALRALVPPGVAEVWTVDEPSRRFGGWLLELEERWARELGRFEHCELSPAYPHPHPSTYDLDALVSGIEPERPGDPSLVLSLRDDRLWGADADAQLRNVARLQKLVTASFPASALTAVGVGGEAPLPDGVADLRSRAPGQAEERRWLALMRRADLAVGVHGSNMLLASGLAAATIELIGEERYGNAFQGTLLSESDPIAALGAHRVVYGDKELTDVSPDRVAALALSILREGDRFRRMMTGAAAGQTDEPVPLIHASPPPPPAREPRPRPNPVAVLRRVRTAVAGRREEGPRALPAPPAVLTDRRGFRFELETADEIGAFVRSEGHFEADEIELAASLLEPGMLAVDVGANIGAFTVALASAVAPGGTVLAFEPHAGSRQRLARTLELNGLTNVVVDERAVAEEPGQAELFEYGPGFESWATLAPRRIEHEGRPLDATRTPVATTTLDEYGIERIDLLKIDVEGAEERVLRGAAGLLGRGAIGAIVLEISDNTLEVFGARALDVLDLLERRGLRTFVVRGGRLRGFRVAGPYRDELANVFALSPEARARAAEAIA